MGLAQKVAQYIRSEGTDGVCVVVELHLKLEKDLHGVYDIAYLFHAILQVDSIGLMRGRKGPTIVALSMHLTVMEGVKGKEKDDCHS